MKENVGNASPIQILSKVPVVKQFLIKSIQWRYGMLLTGEDAKEIVDGVDSQ